MLFKTFRLPLLATICLTNGLPQADGSGVCLTAEQCRQTFLAMNLGGHFYENDWPTKGCFLKNTNGYFGTNGTNAEMSETDLPGIQVRILCDEVGTDSPTASPSPQTTDGPTQLPTTIPVSGEEGALTTASPTTPTTSPVIAEEGTPTALPVTTNSPSGGPTAEQGTNSTGTGSPTKQTISGTNSPSKAPTSNSVTNSPSEEWIQGNSSFLISPGNATVPDTTEDTEQGAEVDAIEPNVIEEVDEATEQDEIEEDDEATEPDPDTSPSIEDDGLGFILDGITSVPTFNLFPPSPSPTTRSPTKLPTSAPSTVSATSPTETSSTEPPSNSPEQIPTIDPITSFTIPDGYLEEQIKTDEEIQESYLTSPEGNDPIVSDRLYVLAIVFGVGLLLVAIYVFKARRGRRIEREKERNSVVVSLCSLFDIFLPQHIITDLSHY